MKKLAIALCFAIAFATPLFGQDACSQNSPLSSSASGVKTFTSSTNGNVSLGGSGNTAYGYEMWTEGGNNNKLIYYGPNQGGGYAYRAEWNNPDDFLGRIGYFWGNGSTYTTYKNIYVDFNYTRSGRSTAGDYSYIGIYGWGRNSSASNANEQLIEYYIVEDWFGNRWQPDTGPLGLGTTGGSEITSFTVDGATYKIIKNLRENKSSIDGNKTFTQIFSIRQTLRKCGTISVTEHFKKWEASPVNLKLGNLYESKFLVEAGGGTGWFELSYLKFSQEEQPRGSSGSSVTSSSSAGGSTTPSSSSNAPTEPQECGEYQTSFCGGLAYSSVPSNSTTMPTTGNCLYIGDFEVIQPALNSTVAINGVENTCGDSWENNGCPYNTKPDAKDGGYYVYVKTGTINSHENNGWKGIVAKAKPACETTPIALKISLTHFSVQTLSGKALHIEANAPTVVEIFDLRGNKVTSLNVSGSQTVKLSLPSGVYFAKARGTESVRFVLR
jgi:Glycosyl hydrolases family 11.